MLCSLYRSCLVRTVDRFDSEGWFSCDQVIFLKCVSCVFSNKSSAVAEMGGRGHNRHGPKTGAVVPLSRELGPRLIQCGLSRGLLPYQAASSSIQPFGHNRHGPKIGWGVGVPFFLGVAGYTSNNMSRRPMPISVRSDILIHAAVWPQWTWAENWGRASPFLR